MRVACAVHVRKWNDEEGMTSGKRRGRRWEEVYPILHEMKNILNRVVVTIKEELVSILPHKWVEPVTIPLVY